jgi:hypothetical protein
MREKLFAVKIPYCSRMLTAQEAARIAEKFVISTAGYNAVNVEAMEPLDNGRWRIRADVGSLAVKLKEVIVDANGNIVTFRDFETNK